MPEVITVTAALRVGSGLMYGQFSKTATQVGSENVAGTQSIATASTAIDFGAVTTVGDVYVENTDATNYVEVDLATTFDKWPQKILPGKAILLHPQSVTMFAKANTAAVAIRVVAAEL